MYHIYTLIIMTNLLHIPIDLINEYILYPFLSKTLASYIPNFYPKFIIFFVYIFQNYTTITNHNNYIYSISRLYT